MIIKRDRYLNKLIAKKGNGLIKVITGIRRCGKSFLLFELYHEYLNSVGVSDVNIIELALDDIANIALTYSEFHSAFEGEKSHAWREYYTYGGMPLILTRKTHEEKSKYLKDLFARTYLSDALEHNRVANDQMILEDLLNIVSSSVGSLTNPTKLANTFQSVKQTSVSSNTIGKYLDYFIDAFIMYKSFRYDIKGKRYIETPLKYYFTDVGLRNVRLNFRQQEENHIMENIIFNELMAREFDVDVGVVEYNTKNGAGKKIRSQLEVDFVANKGSRRYYIQSAFSISDEENRKQEINSLIRIAFAERICDGPIMMCVVYGIRSSGFQTRSRGMLLVHFPCFSFVLAFTFCIVGAASLNIMNDRLQMGNL